MEPDARLTVERAHQPGVEVETADAKPRALAAMLRKGDHGRRRVREAELNPIEGRRLSREAGHIERAQRPEPVRHQAFAARFVAWKAFLIENHDSVAAPGGKEGGGGPGGARANHGDVGVDAVQPSA